MTRLSHGVPTAVPVLTFVLGLLAGWTLRPQSATESGAIPVAGNGTALTNRFPADAQSGAPATIAAVQGEHPVAASGDGVATGLDGDAVRYFPDSVRENWLTESPGEPLQRIPDDPPAAASRSVGGGSGTVITDVESFDEDVWREQLDSLPPEQADEVISIRKRLGRVAAQTLGVESPSFPSMTIAGSEKSARESVSGEPPRRLSLPDESELQPALASSAADSSGLVHLSSGSDAGVPGDLDQIEVPPPPGHSAVSSPISQSAASTDGRRADAVDRFRREVEQVCRLNITNQLTPGFQRSTILVLGVGPDGPNWHSRILPDEGRLTATGCSFDLAIEGDGWFRVDSGDGGCCYTRGGVLGWLEDGRLGVRTVLGCLPLVPEVRCPDEVSGRLLIQEDGRVSIVTGGDEDQAEAVNPLGRISPVRFPDATGLTRISGALFAESLQSGMPYEFDQAVLRQGYLEFPETDSSEERSNAQVLLQLVNGFDAVR